MRSLLVMYPWVGLVPLSVVGLVLAIGLGLGATPFTIALAFCVLAMACSAYRYKATGATLRRPPQHADIVR